MLKQAKKCLGLSMFLIFVCLFPIFNMDNQENTVYKPFFMSIIIWSMQIIL
jgi:Cu/Ag efflux pump CusA